MDNTHMYPDEIMSHINNLLKMKQDDAFEHLELTKKRLLALKLNKELPKNSDVSNKKGKI